MALMCVTGKAKGEYEQEKCNTSYASKSGVVSEASSKQAGNDNWDTKTRFNAIIVKGWGICIMSAQALETQGL